MEGIRISDLEKLRGQGKHVHVNPDGTVTVVDHPPRPTIGQVLAAEHGDQNDREGVASLQQHLVAALAKSPQITLADLQAQPLWKNPDYNLQEQLIAKLEALHMTPHSFLVCHVEQEDCHYAVMEAMMGLKPFLDQVQGHCVVLDKGITVEHVSEQEMNALGWYRKKC